MNDTQLYTELLQLEPPWEVTEVHLDLNQEEIEVTLTYGSHQAPCPECGVACSIYDHRQVRRWRHLDTCQMKTFLLCSVPRVYCSEHGKLTVRTPWARRQSRFTVLFERLAIDMLQSFRKQNKVANLLRISFDQVHLIMRQAVERGLARRDPQQLIDYLGIDEKSFRRHHRYASVLVDLDRSRVIDLVEHRDEQSAINLLTKSLTNNQRSHVKAISMDFWKPYINAAKKILPQADLVHDTFHLIRYLNQAVDHTRRKESSSLEKQQRSALKKTRYLFLSNPENWSDAYQTRFQQIQMINLKTVEAWRIKENFKGFFGCAGMNEAKFFLAEWFHDVEQANLSSVTKVARVFLNHLSGILNYIKHRITNALVEAINSLIQEIKYMARGFRQFENFRISILFYLGKLNLYS